MELFIKAIVLGIIQGLTEFLPVSSSAHLDLIPRMLGWGDAGVAFTAVIQLAVCGPIITRLETEGGDIIDADPSHQRSQIGVSQFAAIFAFAAITLVLLASVHRNEPGHRTLKVAGIASIAVLLVDIYTW